MHHFIWNVVVVVATYTFVWNCAVVHNMRILLLMCVLCSVFWRWRRRWWHSIWSVVSLLLSKRSRPSHRKGTTWWITDGLISRVQTLYIMIGRLTLSRCSVHYLC